MDTIHGMARVCMKWGEAGHHHNTLMTSYFPLRDFHRLHDLRFPNMNNSHSALHVSLVMFPDF